MPTSPSQVLLYHRYEALDLEGHPQLMMWMMVHLHQRCCQGQKGLPPISRPPPRGRWVTVVADSLLRGTESPICWTDPPLREVCCFPGARVKDITRKLPSLVRPSDYYPLLLFRVGGDEVATRSPRAIKRDFRALGRLVRESGAQVIFSSILPVVGSDIGRNRWTQSTKYMAPWLVSPPLFQVFR